MKHFDLDTRGRKVQLNLSIPLWIINKLTTIIIALVIGQGYFILYRAILRINDNTFFQTLHRQFFHL